MNAHAHDQYKLQDNNRGVYILQSYLTCIY